MNVDIRVFVGGPNTVVCLDLLPCWQTWKLTNTCFSFTSLYKTLVSLEMVSLSDLLWSLTFPQRGSVRCVYGGFASR